MGKQLGLFGEEPSAAALAAPEGFDVRGLTFWRTWVEAIVRPVPPGASAPHPKRIDNRSKAPGQRVGKYIALHAGQTIDRDGLAWVNAKYSYGWTEADLSPAGLILGVARVTGFVEDGDHPWFFGPKWKGKVNVGWTLDGVVAFEDPVVHTPRCGLGLWTLPPEVLDAVRARWKAAQAPPDATASRGGSG